MLSDESKGLHSLLKRQLKKSGLLNVSSPGIEQWLDFLQRINRAYHDADQERYLVERSLTISSKEMQAVYERLRHSETRYAVAANGANDGLWDWNLDTNEIYFSPRWKNIVGLDESLEPLTPRDWLERIHPDDRGTVEAEFAAHIEGNTQHFQNEHRLIHADGNYRWVLIRGLAVRNENGVAARIAGSLTDISERKLTERKLEYDALHDTLTGLPNRAMLMERLSRSLERMHHNSSYAFAVLFLDLDRFKIVNDSLGHIAGDQLLNIIAQKLTTLVRPGDMVARLGGDEFVMLLDNLSTAKQAITIANRLIKQLSHPLQIEVQEVYPSTSIGIAYGSTDYDRAENILRDADIAMYRAKAKGKARYEIFNSEMHHRALAVLQLETDLRRAIYQNELVLHYQPIMSLTDEQLIGFEALVRWHHPQKGLIPPNDFIPLAEESELIYPLSEWVLREACAQMRRWDAEIPAARSLIISVNLSAKQLSKPGLVELVQKVLAETELVSERLKLEITESVLMHNAEYSIQLIQQLRALGVCISIDDFGTGYSSLSYLHRFPIDTLKIDRSFIKGIGQSEENSEIIQTIIMLAHNLGIDVIAEGVETNEQKLFLQQMKCSYGQGYFYSKPVASDRAVKLIDLPHRRKSAKQAVQR